MVLIATAPESSCGQGQGKISYFICIRTKFEKILINVYQDNKMIDKSGIRRPYLIVMKKGGTYIIIINTYLRSVFGA